MWGLYEDNIIYRDLKVVNVFVWWLNNYENKYYFDVMCVYKFEYYVVDYEIFIEIVGMGFWRVLEILFGFKYCNRVLFFNLFFEKFDVYSYGMICYEILIGCIFFEGF